MNFDDFVRAVDIAVQQSREATTRAQKENAYNAFFDASIDYFNATMTGDIQLADGRTVFIPAIGS